MVQALDIERSGEAGASAALDRLLANLDGLAPRLAAVARQGQGRVAFATSLGLEDQAVLHAIAEAGADIDVFTLDTGRLFPETLETLERSEQRYGLRIRAVSPEAQAVEGPLARDGAFGCRHSIEARKACCDVRKVITLRRALAGAAVWVTRLRRGQSAGRATVPFAAWDADYRLIKVNPLADWSLDAVEA